uniref:Polycystic kidney disease 1 like 2a n=1 Tax=Oreochromis aureus TaxID=47969 RepID=A0A668RUR5_OREAU
MCQAILHLLILMTLSCHSLAENETNATCPEHQRAFGGSCFEFVGIRRSFFSAQAWCEGNGGHLAFIPDEDTQYFLERHMDTKEDFWFGVAPSAEGHLSWLDGSPLTYSKWVSSPEPGAACGYILRNSGFHWEARNNCTKNRSFICQFESGRTIVCEGRNTTLQCGSGQVLMIDGGFYGRKSIHYCRSKFPPPASPQHECGWADAVESITARCHDRQVCQIAEVANSFADPCPQLKSYLSVDYHCKDGLALSVNPTAVVLGDVRIHVKWLLHSSLTNLSCRVNTGDGHVIYLNNPKGLENSVVHKYTHPSTFIVAAECTCSEMHITAQKIITIQEPVAEIGVITCYAGNLSFSETNCKALYGEAFHIQMEVSAGTNVTYRIESDEKSLSGLSVIRGTEPQNITVTSEMVTHLGSGCHHLTLYASNTVTFLEVSKDLQVCVLEKIVGLQASVLTASDECLDSPFITFGVSLVRGEPVLLLFSLTGDNGLFTETRKMNTKKEMFHIKRPVQGEQKNVNGKSTDPYIHTYTYTYIHIYIYIHTYIHVYTYIYIYVEGEGNSGPRGNRSTRCGDSQARRVAPMLNLDVNPFCWKVGWDISRFVGSLSLTTKEGSVIPVENLSEDIQVVFPRFAGEQVNTTILDLGNFSTTVIDIPSANSTLVLKMMPSKVPLPFKVLLGYNDYPTETNYVAATEMPQQGATQEEKYTWLLHPEDLKGNTGVHYLVVRPIVGPGIKSINASLSITPITTSCKFWNESLLDWSNSGCRVGANTTHLETQCLCNHLTFFGNSFFVTPNLVDPSRTAELFATFANNPVVVCFVAALFLAYLLVLVWARRKDIQDTVKVKVTEVEDNDPMDEYRYLLSVCTGHRIGASTSSQVTVTLLGTEGHSEPHHLTDSKKRVFERGAVDMFLLTTPFSLGDLQGIRLWHNNSGSHPAWYVGNVMVQDLQTEEKWHFLCNSWLSVDIDDCSLDKIFPAASEMDLKRFSNLFFTKTTKDFKDGHLWISVISRPPSSHFTRVQRVSCCFSLLLCTMLTSIMFYGIPTDPSQQVMDLGSFEFTWQQFMIGVQSSLIMFPVNILIVSIFRFTRPREFSCCHRKKKKKNTQDSSATTDMTNSVSLDLIIKNLKMLPTIMFLQTKYFLLFEHIISCASLRFPSNNICTFSDSSASAEGVIQKKRNKSQYLYRQLCHIDSELSQLGPSGFPNPHSYKQALQQVQSMKELLEDQLVASNRGVPDEPTNKTTCCHGGLPWWFIFVGWLLVIATSVVSGYFTMMYGLKFGKPRSISWLVSMVISFFQSVLLIQPLKVLCFAIFFALVIKKVDEEDFQNQQTSSTGEQMFVRYGSVYEPPPHADVERMRRNRMLEQKAFALIREILIYMGFLWMLLLVAHGQRDPNAFYLNTHITQSFCGNAPATMAIQDVFNWASTSVLSNLFGQYPGFITDGNSKLLGNARLRQLRVKKNSCQIAGPMLKMVPDCSAPYSWEAEDMGSYGPGWNTSVGNNISASISSPWTYQTHSQLRAYPVWGELALYRGGGFSVELGPDLQTATSTLNYLFNNMWFDMYTRAIFVEFTVYNANVNLLCIVTLLLESPAVGAFQLNSEMQSVHLYLPGDGLRICIITTEIIYMLFILYYMFNQGKLMKQQRWLYFKNKWNLLELSIILLSWSAVAAFIQKTLIANRDIAYYQNHKDKFVSFYQTGTSESLFQYLMAFLVLLATVKLWHLLRLNPKMNMITAALQRAWTNISGLLLIIVIMLLAYSIACNVIYGWNLSSYKTFMDALMTLIGLQIGIFNYDEVLSSNPVLGGLLIGSCIVFVTFVVLNLLLSVILVAFNQEQKYHKPSEEEEIVDLMLMKICSLFGIKRKHAKDTRETIWIFHTYIVSI